nr:SLATT domain-containing protein [Pedobacter panaciterrae]
MADEVLGENIQQMSVWDPKKATEIIIQMQAKSIARVNWIYGWYVKTKKDKAQASKIIRVACVILFILTALVPLVHLISEKLDVPLSLGYIFAALGSGLLFLDKFYGYSTGWLRVNRAITDLVDAKRNFELLMQTSLLLHPADTQTGFQALSDTIGTFNENISTIIKAETAQWEKEFQAGSDELQKYFAEQINQQKPGDLQITVVNYSTYSAIEVFINGTSSGIISGGTKLIKSLPPDNYEVKIKTTLLTDGKVTEKTSIGSVKASALVVVEFK